MYHIFVDCETTGLDPYKNGIIQLSGIILAKEENQFIYKDHFDIKMNTLARDVVEKEALEVSGTSFKELEKRMSGVEARNLFKSVLSAYVDPYNKTDKMMMYGYNVRFDSDFIRAWFQKQGDMFFGSWFWWPPVDVMSKAADALVDVRASMPNFKLDTVARQVGLNVDDTRTHDAMYDIELTFQLYTQLTGRIQILNWPTANQQKEEGGNNA